jgi:hypothetical protein
VTCCARRRALLVCLAVERFHGTGLLRDVLGVAEDRRGGVFVAVRGVFDQLLLGELEALGLAPARLLDRPALLEPTRLEVEVRLRCARIFHRHHSSH